MAMAMKKDRESSRFCFAGVPRDGERRSEGGRRSDDRGEDGARGCCYKGMANLWWLATDWIKRTWGDATEMPPRRCYRLPLATCHLLLPLAA